MLRKPIFIVLFVLALATLACGTGTPGGSTPQETGVSGEQIFRNQGCAECHGENSFVSTPSLEGVFGAEVQLDSGETVIADENYIRESILSPEAEIVRGYQPIMPGYQGRLSEEQLDALVEYIRSLAD